MRILIVSSTQNSAAQALLAELAAAGHDVATELHGRGASRLRETAARFRPEVIVGLALTRAFPETLLREGLCLVIEPEIHMDGETADVVLREASEDARVLATRRLPPLRALKPGPYRRALAELGAACILGAIAPPAPAPLP